MSVMTAKKKRTQTITITKETLGMDLQIKVNGMEKGIIAEVVEMVIGV